MHSRTLLLGGLVWGESDRPRDVRVATGRAVDQGVRGVDLHHLEGRIRPSVVRNDVTHCESLPARENLTRGATRAGNDALHRAGEVPTRPSFAELHDPRPHVSGRGLEVEPTVHHHVGLRHDVVAGAGCRDLGRRRSREPLSHA